MTPQRKRAARKGAREPKTYRMGTSGGPSEGAIYLKAKPPGKNPTVAERLDYLCEQEKATYEITTDPETGEKSIALIYEDGTKVGGRGGDITAAMDRLEKRAKAFKKLAAEE
jgi:hypothetical protein